MRITPCLTLLTVGFLAIPAGMQGGPREDALKVIERGIQVHGGEGALAKAQACTRKYQGTLVVGSESVPFTQVKEVIFPDKQRLKTDLDKRASTLSVINGKNGWFLAGGTVNQIGAAVKEEIRQEMQVWYLTTLIPLRKEQYELKPADAIRVDDKPASGIKVSSAGQPDIILYFDNGTGKLVKIVTKVPLGGLTVDKEYFLSAYKEFDGALLATQVLEMIDGHKVKETKGCTFDLRKPDEGVFNKP